MRSYAASSLMRVQTAHRHGRDHRSVLVTTGATDLGGIGRRASFDLLERDPAVEVVRVVGPDTPVGKASDHPRERLLVAPPDLAGALAAASVYVGAAGTTAVQAACVGIPAVITAAVANQAAQAAALSAAGCATLAAGSELADGMPRAARRPRAAARRWQPPVAHLSTDAEQPELPKRSETWSRPAPRDDHRCGDPGSLRIDTISAQGAGAAPGSPRCSRTSSSESRGPPASIVSSSRRRITRAMTSVAALAVASGAAVTRGSEDDVLSSYLLAAREHDAERHRAHHR